MAYLEKAEEKCCGNMELMKLPSNKSVLTTGQTLIPTGGFTIGQAISGNTLREWQTQSAEVFYWMKSKMKICIRHRFQNERVFHKKEIAPLVHLTTGAIYAIHPCYALLVFV